MEVWTKELESTYFQREMGTPARALMCNTKKTLCVTGKKYIVYSSLYVLKELVDMLDIGIYGILLVKKFRNLENSYLRILDQCPLFKKPRMTASQEIGRVLTLMYFLCVPPLNVGPLNMNPLNW